MITKFEIVDLIRMSERERDGVTALHPERYWDLAESIEILINSKNKPTARSNSRGNQSAEFMSIREDFASKAMQGFLANSAAADVTIRHIIESLGLPEGTKYNPEEHFTKYVAILSVQHADVLIAELSKPGNQ